LSARRDTPAEPVVIIIVAAKARGLMLGKRYRCRVDPARWTRRLG
jgi:hypothetical protein